MRALVVAVILAGAGAAHAQSVATVGEPLPTVTERYVIPGLAAGIAAGATACTND